MPEFELHIRVYRKNTSVRVVSMFCECNKANMDSVRSLKSCHSMLLLILED